MRRKQHVVMMLSVWLAIAVSLVFAIERHNTSREWLETFHKGMDMASQIRLTATGTVTEPDGSIYTVEIEVVQVRQGQSFAELREFLAERKQEVEEGIGDGATIVWGAPTSASGGLDVSGGGTDVNRSGPVGDFVRRRVSVGSGE